jgi:hypothetical protein
MQYFANLNCFHFIKRFSSMSVGLLKPEEADTIIQKKWSWEMAKHQLHKNGHWEGYGDDNFVRNCPKNVSENHKLFYKFITYCLANGQGLY